MCLPFLRCISATAAAVLACATATPALAGQLDRIRESQQIVLAHREASVPFSYVLPDGAPVGYALDLCLKVVEAVRRELGLRTLEVRYLPVTSASRIPAIAEGRAALECGSTTNTAERRKQVAFTIPHFISASRLLVRTADGIAGLEAMAGKRIAVTAGTTTVPVLRRLDTEKAMKLQIVEVRDHAEAFAALEGGRTDAFVLDDVLLYGLRANASVPQAYTVVGKPITIEPYAVMLPKDDPAFKKVVDQEMRRLIQTGEAQRIYARWFQQPIPPKGIRLDLPMTALLRDAFRFPSDRVGDLAD